MRLPVEQVRRLERILGGDPVTEEMVLRFIVARYAAKNLFHLPANVATQILRRPQDFLHATKRFCEPELTF